MRDPFEDGNGLESEAKKNENGMVPVRRVRDSDKIQIGCGNQVWFLHISAVHTLDEQQCMHVLPAG